MAVNIDWGALRTVNPLAEIAKGQAFAQDQQDNALRQQQRQTRQQASQMYAAGDTAGARKAAISGGDFDLAGEFGRLDEQQRATVREKNERLGRILFSVGQAPYEKRRDAIASAMQDLVDAGLPQDKIASFDPTDDNLRPLIDQHLSLKELMDRDEKQTSRAFEREKFDYTREKDAATPFAMDPDKNYFVRDGLAAEPRRRSTGPANVDDVWAAAIQQESSGRPGVIGPQTDYGRAQGLTQMLPATAQAMAQKIGVPWRPELMTGTTPEAAQYQERLGRAYFDEGLEKYGGDPEKALMYYHGGPDESIWGPKTRQHARAVLARVQPYEVASAGETPPPSGSAGDDDLAPSGMRQIQTAKPKPQPRPATAAEKAAYGIASDVPAMVKPDGTLDVISGTGAGNTNPRKAEADLRKEFNARPEVKEFREVSNAFRNIQAAAENVSAAGDLSLIFAYMKMLDPTSVVREGEFATAQNAAGIPDRVVNAYNKALKGERLNTKQRQDFTNSAGLVYRNRKSRFDEISGEYRSYASDYGVDPNRVVTESKAPANQGGGIPEAARKAYVARSNAGQVDRSAPQGTERNPFVAVNNGVMDRLPVGSYVIAPDGSFGVIE